MSDIEHRVELRRKAAQLIDDIQSLVAAELWGLGAQSCGELGQAIRQLELIDQQIKQEASL